MRKTKLLYSLALAPLLLGGYNQNEIGTAVDPLTVTTLAKCPDGQFLVYRGGAVGCEVINGSGILLPDCKSQDQLLTYNSVGELTQYRCTPKGSITISATDTTTINDLQTKLTLIGSTITSLGTGARVSSRTYRGLTDTAVSGNLGGIKQAASSCVAKFGANASMCDAYSIYASIAAGKIDLTADITGAWVYQSDWTSGPTGAAIPAAGLADNCAGYTSAATTAGLFGTKFSLALPTGDATNRVPKFYNNTTCDTLLKIACCQ